jgi:uncharacterized OB-fold protein
MTGTDFTGTGLVTVDGAWNFTYRYFAGETASRFFADLRDHRRITGRRCPRCERVLVPARSWCDRCFEATTDWVAVGTEGVVETFTVLTAAFPGMPEPPLAIAYVTLDGAGTALLNFVEGLDLTDLDAAAAVLLDRPRAEVVFHDERSGRMTDFHFRVSAEAR